MSCLGRAAVRPSLTYAHRCIELSSWGRIPRARSALCCGGAVCLRSRACCQLLLYTSVAHGLPFLSPPHSPSPTCASSPPRQSLDQEEAGEVPRERNLRRPSLLGAALTFTGEGAPPYMLHPPGNTQRAGGHLACLALVWATKPDADRKG